MFTSFKQIIKVLICGIGIGFGLIVFIQRLLKKKQEKTCEIEIKYKENTAKVKALIDSRKFVKRENIGFASCNSRRKIPFKFFERYKRYKDNSI